MSISLFVFKSMNVSEMSSVYEETKYWRMSMNVNNQQSWSPEQQQTMPQQAS